MDTVNKWEVEEILESLISPKNSVLNGGDASIQDFELNLLSDESPPPESFKAKKKCVICVQGDAADCSFYGGKDSCISCRAFFGRAVKSQTYKKFKCSERGRSKCVVDSKSRRSCKFCRFQRCIKFAGMKTELVKVKGEILPSEMNQGLTTEELKMIQKTTENINEVIFMKYLDFYHYYPEHFINMLFSIKSGHRIPFRTIQAWEYLERSAVFPLCILQIEEVGYLSSSDRRILLQQSYPKYFGLSWYSLGKKDPNSFFINLRNRKGVSEAQLNTFKSILEELSIFNETDNISVVQYEAIYAPSWASSWEVEENHKKLQNRILHLSRKDPNSPRDPILYTLLILMLLFSTDGTDFTDPDTVEKLHLKYSRMLYKYLRSYMAPEKAQLKYAQCLLLSKDTHKIYELHSKMVPS